MAEQQAPLKTYRGNCHCAAFVYEITLPEIKQLSECNCSVCYKKAALWVFPKPSDVKFIKGDTSELTNYNFNSNKFTHKFCSTCGVSVMVVGHLTPPKAGEDKLPENGFNVRTFQHGQIDVWKIETKAFDGKSLPGTYAEPKFTGPEPAGTAEDGQVYTGGCHCGAITIGVRSKPIDKDLQGLIECDCSICGRYGATWIYLPHPQIVIEGRENLGTYLFRHKIAAKLFCKVCGVPVGSEPAPLGDDEVARLEEAARGWYVKSKTVKTLNLRTISGLDVKELSPTRFNGYGFIQPGYTEP